MAMFSLYRMLLDTNDDDNVPGVLCDLATEKSWVQSLRIFPRDVHVVFIPEMDNAYTAIQPEIKQFLHSKVAERIDHFESGLYDHNLATKKDTNTVDGAACHSHGEQAILRLCNSCMKKTWDSTADDRSVAYVSVEYLDVTFSHGTKSNKKLFIVSYKSLPLALKVFQEEPGAHTILCRDTESKRMFLDSVQVQSNAKEWKRILESQRILDNFEEARASLVSQLKTLNFPMFKIFTQPFGQSCSSHKKLLARLRVTNKLSPEAQEGGRVKAEVHYCRWLQATIARLLIHSHSVSYETVSLLLKNPLFQAKYIIDSVQQFELNGVSQHVDR